MKYMGSMIVVKDLKKSKNFYKDVLGLEVIIDFGANITLTGGFSLQTEESWKEFININTSDLSYKSKTFELYFEEDKFDEFLESLNKYNISYLHPLKEHPWGQRGIRFYDPDMHIIEVGETLTSVIKRFMNNGMTVEEAAIRMDISLDYAKSIL